MAPKTAVAPVHRRKIGEQGPGTGNLPVPGPCFYFSGTQCCALRAVPRSGPDALPCGKVKHRAGTVQRTGIACQRFVQRQLGKVEPAHQYIRAEPFHKVQDALVEAAADQHPLPRLFNQKILLVAEILRHKGAVPHGGKPKASQVVAAGPCIAGVQGQPVAQGCGFALSLIHI